MSFPDPIAVFRLEAGELLEQTRLTCSTRETWRTAPWWMRFSRPAYAQGVLAQCSGFDAGGLHPPLRNG